MCLAVPMMVIQIDGPIALVEAEGVSRQARVDFLPNLRVGEYVLVHAGLAIERVDAAEAAETLRLVRMLANADS
ncbi:MAG: HypC/HybG/HupF family hydrogenase formation chaperone [Armatimonadota bacterium]